MTALDPRGINKDLDKGSLEYRMLKGVAPLDAHVLVPNPRWHGFLEAATRQKNALPLIDGKRQQFILAIDPGETTGVAYGEILESKLVSIRAMQYDTSELDEAYPWLTTLFGNPYDFLVVEDYRVYGHKAESHKWESLHTAKLIGAINATHQSKIFREAYDAQAGQQFANVEEMFVMPYKKTMAKEAQAVFRMAQQPKVFCTDKKLDEWGLNPVGLKHARDAVRHLCFHLMFGGSQKNNISFEAPK